jgi:transposase
VQYQVAKNRNYGVNLCEGCLEKQREIDRLREENQRLRQKLRLNERKQQQGFFGAATPSAQVPVKVNAAPEQRQRQGGAQPGHRGAGRARLRALEADERQVLACEEEVCPACQAPLQAHSASTRAVYEYEAEKVRKVLYELARKRCPRCRQTVCAQPRGVLPRALLSNRLLVGVAWQHYVEGRPLGRLAESLQLNYGTLCGALQRVGKLLAPCLTKLKESYRQALVRHADETRWRTDGVSGYSWYFGSARVSLYLYRPTRGSVVVREVLGSAPLAGVLVVDRYVGYNQVPCRLQYCYAHLLRDLQAVGEEFENELEVQTYVSAMQGHLADAMRLRQRPLSEAQYYAEAARLQTEIQRLSEQEARHAAVRTWQDFFVAQAERLYQWVQDRAVPADNNYAEREIRKTVIARKVSFGSQSAAGAKMREIWMSVLHSLRKREDDPAEKLVEGLNRKAQEAQLNLAEALFGLDSG